MRLYAGQYSTNVLGSQEGEARSLWGIGATHQPAGFLKLPAASDMMGGNWLMASAPSRIGL